MAPSSGSKEGGKRPNPLRSTKSFPRPEAQDANTAKSRPQRANTLQNGAATEASASQRAKENQARRVEEEPDTFASTPSEDSSELPRASVDLDDLPIELIGLADSFVESLSAKVHNVPPNIDKLSRMFQDFYAQAAAHINTHIATLISRQSREQSPAPTLSSRNSAASILRAKAASIGNRDKANTPPPKQDAEQQMLTPAELAERKKARKAIEQKRGHYEEAVERRLCEGIYSRIYRHHTTSDEAQDDKLRSKTAALAVVGIGPADLGVHLGDLPSETPEAMAERQEEVRNWLTQARKELVLMHESRYPLGKLNRLKSAHKAIVDTLAHFHPSSSADEIMPMLIYTLITLPPENLNVISDLNFIQRFRWEQKIEGEAAYCLTNLEAAIVFLDTVDLSTLRADEAPSGPLKSMPSKPPTPSTETFPPAYAAASQPETTTVTATGLKSSPAASLKTKDLQLRNRRLSDLVNTPAQAFSSASDAVLNTFNAADQGIKTIGTSLEGSYKLFFSKFSKQGDEPSARGGDAPIAIPKTLEDARKLIGTPPPNDDDGTASGASSLHSLEDTDRHRPKTTRDDRTLSLLVGNRGTPGARDHSADSARSARSAGSSGRKTSFFGPGAMTSMPDDARKEGVVTPLDSIRNLGNSLNPMSRLSAGIGGFRGFGRAPTSTSSVPTTTTTPPPKEAARATDGGDLATAFPDLALALPPKPQIDPPKQRFMELQNPADLRIGEVLELLRDYRRLANALNDRQAFKGQ